MINGFGVPLLGWRVGGLPPAGSSPAGGRGCLGSRPRHPELPECRSSPQLRYAADRQGAGIGRVDVQPIPVTFQGFMHYPGTASRTSAVLTSNPDHWRQLDYEQVQAIICAVPGPPA